MPQNAHFASGQGRGWRQGLDVRPPVHVFLSQQAIGDSHGIQISTGTMVKEARNAARVALPAMHKSRQQHRPPRFRFPQEAVLAAAPAVASGYRTLEKV